MATDIHSKKAVILLSGGVDSSTTAAIVKAEGYEFYALSLDYAQRHRLELESAKMVADVLGAKKHLTIRFDLEEIGGSALTTDMKVPKISSKSIATGNELKTEEKESLFAIHCPSLIPDTYVPARNTIFLSFALSWAEVLEVTDIFIGANAVDYSGYPDCRPEYLKAFEEMANLSTKAAVEGRIRVRINAPLLYMTKAEIIRKGVGLGFDYSLTWSCYDPQPRDAVCGSLIVPCGRCDSCRFRAKGFEGAGFKDPLLSRLRKPITETA
ncbi:7-cyano-7-deazaguanine synthase QueC [Thermodesulfovibrionales bacterium]|nr:7-cyano-7-deazaguanine synthase QueC [Thermodesulfovibrionales bacterium]